MSPATTGLPFPGNRLLDRLGDMALTTGTRLGPYEITAPIGAGGMGEVYSARDTRLDRQVAIKVLPPDFAHDAALLERFQREAKTISSLNHPHICTLFDVGEEEGVRFLVMELLEGEPLVDRVAKGALPLDQVLKLGAQIAEAMGWNTDEVQERVIQSPVGKAFRSMLFARVVPNLKRLGLLTPYVRKAFEEMRILHFEDLNPDEADRALGIA